MYTLIMVGIGVSSDTDDDRESDGVALSGRRWLFSDRAYECVFPSLSGDFRFFDEIRGMSQLKIDCQQRGSQRCRLVSLTVPLHLGNLVPVPSSGPTLRFCASSEAVYWSSM